MNSGWIVSMRFTDEEYRMWLALKAMATPQTWAGAARVLMEDPVIRGRITEMIADYDDWSPSH